MGSRAPPRIPSRRRNRCEMVKGAMLLTWLSHTSLATRPREQKAVLALKDLTGIKAPHRYRERESNKRQPCAQAEGHWENSETYGPLREGHSINSRTPSRYCSPGKAGLWSPGGKSRNPCWRTRRSWKGMGVTRGKGVATGWGVEVGTACGEGSGLGSGVSSGSGVATTGGGVGTAGIPSGVGRGRPS